MIVGTPSFGKGSVQTVIPLRDGSALRLTTSKYYTPNGEQIHESGITPDVVVEYKKIEQTDEKEVKIDLIKQDNQVEAALKLLKGINIYQTLKTE